MSEIQDDGQSHAVLKNLVTIELCDNLTFLITDFHFKQRWLHVIIIGVQEYILFDDAIERVSNQAKLTFGESHFALETG